MIIKLITFMPGKMHVNKLFCEKAYTHCHLKSISEVFPGSVTPTARRCMHQACSEQQVTTKQARRVHGHRHLEYMSHLSAVVHWLIDIVLFLLCMGFFKNSLEVMVFNCFS